MALAEDILRVTERLYAAAAAPDQWTPALQGVIDLLGGDHATLDVHGNERIGAGFVANARVDERDLANLLKSELMQLGLPLLGRIPGGLSMRTQIISDADFARSAVYNEVLRPLNGFHSVHIRRNGASESYLLSVCRPQHADNFEAPALSTLQVLMPHLSTAVGLHSRLRLVGEAQTGLAGALDRFETGVILTDAAGRPVFVNPRAARIAADADGLILDEGGIAAATPVATRRLREAVAVASMDAAVESRRLYLERPSQRLPLLLTVFPIWRLGVAVPGTAAPRVAIFIAEPDAPPPIDRIAISDIFRLTPRESEIAMLVADGFDLATIASRLGLGLGTVRDHLKHVFEKTGTRSQAALVARLRGFVDRMH